MTGPGPYLEALASLHRARSASERRRASGASARAARTAALASAREALDVQRSRVAELAGELRVSLPAATAPPPAPRTPSWDQGHQDLSDRLRAVTAGIDVARAVAGRPQLLPGWTSPAARAAAVHGAFGLVAAVLTVALSLLGVHGSTPALAFFVVLWPATAAVVGGGAVTRLGAPRLPAGSAADPAATATGTPAGRPRPYRWLGVLLCWAGWLVPGLLLDRIAALVPG